MDKAIIQYVDHGHTIGVTAYLNAYSYVKINDSKYPVLLDIFGRETAVKAISSAFLSQRSILIQKGQSITDISASYELRYKRMKSNLRLPEVGKIHREVIIADTNRIVYIPQGEDKSNLLFKAFDTASTIPIYEGWKEELINNLFKDNYLIKLESEGIDGDIYIYNGSEYFLSSFDFDGYAEKFLDKKYPQRTKQDEEAA